MLKDVRAAVDRLAQRVDGVEATSMGGAPGVAQPFAPSTPGAVLCPTVAAACTATGGSSASNARPAGACTEILGRANNCDSAGGCSRLVCGRGDNEASLAHNGSSQGAETEKLPQLYFSNLPYAQVSCL